MRNIETTTKFSGLKSISSIESRTVKFPKNLRYLLHCKPYENDKKKLFISS